MKVSRLTRADDLQVEDHYGNKQWRQEHSSKPMEVHGSYGYHDVNGVYREVTYVADKDGFRAKIKTNEPGMLTAKEPAATHIDSYYPSVPNELKHVKSSRQKKPSNSRPYLDPLLDHKKYLLSSFYKSQKNYP